MDYGRAGLVTEDCGQVGYKNWWEQRFGVPLPVQLKMLVQIPGTLAMETTVTTGQKPAVDLRDFISYASIALCQDPPKWLFYFNKDSVLSFCATRCFLHCGMWERSQGEPASREKGLLWNRELHSQTSNHHCSLRDLPLRSGLLRGHLPHGHLFCLVTSFPTSVMCSNWLKSKHLKLHQVNCGDKASSLLGNQFALAPSLGLGAAGMCKEVRGHSSPPQSCHHDAELLEGAQAPFSHGSQ